MNGSVSGTARRLLEKGEVEKAVALVGGAANRGDGGALHELALWHVFGHPVRRNFRTARALFARAASADNEAAALAHALFVAIGAGGDPDWKKGVELLRQAARHSHAAARQIKLIDAMKIDVHGILHDLPTRVPISASPKITISPGLFSPEECAHIICLAKPLLKPSIVVDSASGLEIPHPVRTSDGAVLGPVQMDLVVEALNRRIAAVTGTLTEQGEPLAVLRYKESQQYRLHHDCLPGETNQRILTAIIFLTDRFEGGATFFPALGSGIRGRMGDALFFANTNPDGGVDQRSLHAGLPVTKGQKWICTRWIRANSFDPWGMR